MVGEWPMVPLGDLLQVGRRISYGIVQPGHHQDCGIPIVRVSDIRGGRIDTSGPLRVDAGIEAQYERTRIRGGELLLTLVGTVGEAAIAPHDLVGWNLARAVGLIPIREDVGAEWVIAVLRTPSIRNRIASRVNTTVQTTFNLADVVQLPIPLPDRSVRAAIVELLGSLDDRIELNREMAETLEAMARALFKSWFVDFDPVHARAEGRPTGLPDDIATLFPDRCGDDGVPQGWEHRSVYDFARIIYGAPFASSFFNSDGIGRPLIRIRDLATHDPSIFTDEEHRASHVINAGDVVVGMDGEFRCHLWRGPSAYLNQRLCHFEQVDDTSKAFVALALEAPLARFESGAVGTTVIHLGKKDLDTVRFPFPGRCLLRAFGAVCDPLLSRSVLGSVQSRTLSLIRDTLLPKLISGELRIADAAQRVAAA